MMSSARTGLARLAAAAMLLLAACIPASALAAGKVALLIGNSDYVEQDAGGSWNDLPNPGNDVELVGAKLSEIGFTVIIMKNGSKATLDDALDEFARYSDGADIALFYFAGHGFEYARKHYLVPVDAPLEVTSDQLPAHFLELERVASRLTGADKLIFMLDACRNGEGLVGEASASGTTRQAMTPVVRDASFGGGATASNADYDFPPDADYAVLYSTGRGVPAYDSAPPPADVSPFAYEVARYITVPRVAVTQVISNIVGDVYRRTSAFAPPQKPVTYNSLPPDVYLIDQEPEAMRAMAMEQAATGTRPPLNISLEEMARVDEDVLITRVLAEHSPTEIKLRMDEGDPVATYLYGFMQYSGSGIAKDLAGARQTLERAAAFGTPYGLLELAFFLREHGTESDADRALDLYRQAAAMDYPKAKAHYAYVLSEGVLVPKSDANDALALDLFRQATANDYPWALYSLSAVDEEGAQAQWLDRLVTLAKAGDDDAARWACRRLVAQANVAGRGGDVATQSARKARAFPFCQQSADANFASPVAWMATAKAEGWVGAPDLREARVWMLQALGRRDLPAGDCARMLMLRQQFDPTSAQEVGCLQRSSADLRPGN